jgi:hypothetical protein
MFYLSYAAGNALRAVNKAFVVCPWCAGISWLPWVEHSAVPFYNR